ncbi:hypothetical protein [Caballeronia sp.]|uniref:hypothetical protein n=1 Tax=Caballeronia sp. TaxID=1931223 RepID=UPI003C511EDA
MHMITKAEMKLSQACAIYRAAVPLNINISNPDHIDFIRIRRLISTEPRLVPVATMESMPGAIAGIEGKRSKPSLTPTDARQGERLRLRPHVA